MFLSLVLLSLRIVISNFREMMCYFLGYCPLPVVVGIFFSYLCSDALKVIKDLWWYSLFGVITYFLRTLYLFTLQNFIYLLVL